MVLISVGFKLIIKQVFHNFRKIIGMKRLLSCLIVLGLCLLVSGQIVESFNYQTIVHNSHGKPVASRVVTFRCSILSGNDYDSVIYSENHKAKTDKRGLVTLKIGNGTEETGDFKHVDWSSDKYFLKVETDTTGKTNYTEMGITQILVVSKTFPVETSKDSSLSTEDKLFISRKYIGKFLDYRQTGPKDENGPNIIWIKTTMESTYGKISAYGKKCQFSAGNNLYIRRSYYSPGLISGYWFYQIENDNNIYYRLSDFQYDRKVKVESFFK
jgi:hypothetical protein